MAGHKLLNGVRGMRWWEWVLGAALTIIPLAVSFTVTFATGQTDSVTAYRDGRLKIPSFAPPSWLFGPMWTVLYLLMGLASFLVFKLGGGMTRDTVPALLLYALQLGLNIAWSPIFFVHGLLSLGLLFIGTIWGLIVACMVAFWNCSKVASALLLPYLIWVSVASALNYEIVRLNGSFFDFRNTSAITTPSP